MKISCIYSLHCLYSHSEQLVLIVSVDYYEVLTKVIVKQIMIVDMYCIEQREMTVGILIV
jgi:hypothetical protein